MKHRFHGLITFTKTPKSSVVDGISTSHATTVSKPRFEKPIRMTTRPVEPLGGTVRCAHRMSSDTSVAREDGCCRSTVCRKTIASSRLKRSAATAASSAQSAGQSQSTRGLTGPMARTRVQKPPYIDGSRPTAASLLTVCSVALFLHGSRCHVDLRWCSWTQQSTLVPGVGGLFFF